MLGSRLARSLGQYGPDEDALTPDVVAEVLGVWRAEQLGNYKKWQVPCISDGFSLRHSPYFGSYFTPD